VWDLREVPKDMLHPAASPGVTALESSPS
jgi:hypothetical protein